MWWFFRKKPNFRKYDWKYIIIHHSLTKDSKTVSWQAITRYHRDTKGWDYNGYHFGIELVNDNYEIFMGRPLNMNGAHTQGMNRKAIGICVVGNFDVEKPPEKALRKLAVLVKSLMDMFNIPIYKIRGHNYYSSKSCPGKLFDLDLFKREYIEKI